MSPAFRTSLLPLCFTVAFVSFAATGSMLAQNATANAVAPTSTDRSSAYYHYGLAKIYEDEASGNGRQDLATQAIEQYKLALDADPGSRMLQDGLSNLYFKLGRIREAVTAAQDQVAKHPDDADAHMLLGRVYLRSLGDGQSPQSSDMLQMAIKEYEKIAELKPNDLETHLLLGQLYGLNHDSAKAEAQFKAAQQIDGSSEEVVLSMARLYSEQGDLQRAAKVIADVSEDDRSARMDFALAGIYDQLKQPKQAVAAYRATLDQDPDNTDAKRGLANALIANGETDAAAKIFAEIISSDPQDAQSLIREADIQRQQGHYEQALATLKKAGALVSNNLELNYNEALVYDALGRYDEAIKTLKDMLASTEQADGKYDDQARGNRALFLERLAIVYRESNKTQEAVEAYKQIQALGGDFQARGADGLVQAYRDGHQWPEALRAAADAAKAMPTNRDIQLTYASQLGDAGKLDEAIKLANAQLSGKTPGTPEDRIVYFTIADIYSRAKRWKETSAALDKVEALSAKPEDKVFLYSYKATIADKQKMFDEAESEYRKGLAIDPQSAAIQNDYGFMLADRGIRLDEAVTMLKKAVAYDPQNGAFLDSLAWAYYKQGQYALAEDYAQKAVARAGNDPTVLDHLGEIYAKTGKLPQAVVQWQKSLAQYATSLAPEADPSDVEKVQHKLEGARVKLAHANITPENSH
ncbi:tetratricopeptide repeat protein [Granulicella mallensis]|uniref:TPR repeat-containing protein n=1 Tax=Granulicella mallensis (strain ATCC BAA-1857 / DSM 23137 / MP5ACTX8) TaxID=682795 RepID=G8NUN3_GRAMM|nr:tetratricopeptide repeat protein [Granulicella mallensis]AEU36484.1 TPR repeat-containing protein [Granulicella mallensis MP5ACTX8]